MKCWRHLAVLLLAALPAQAQTNDLLQRRWTATTTTHFRIYSCGAPQEVNRLAARLEQFCKAYSLLAGSDSIASPPISVVAFPDHETMKPFLPLYNGQPGHISGFFDRGSDENLIVLSLSDAGGMEIIFHEYAPLLFRHNDLIWPLWLKEGMAEIYSTFALDGSQAEIARPIGHHLELLAHEPMMPLHELFSVTHDSPQYNEGTRQGIFYAESWLLADYLMAGDSAVLKSRFGRFTELLRAGQMPEQAFTNALGVSLSAMEMALKQYLARGIFSPIKLPLALNPAAPVYVTVRTMTPVETEFQLGDELLRIDRAEEAENYFARAQKLAPASPLPYEGLGLVAAERDRRAEAVQDFQKSLQLGSADFLTHYFYAKEKFEMTGDGQGNYRRIHDKDLAATIDAELEKSLALMPNFAGAQELLGFFEMVQGDDLAAAEKHLDAAIQLEPENPSYLFSLAQAQIRQGDLAAARLTLRPLLLPNADATLRQPAEEMMRKMNGN